MVDNKNEEKRYTVNEESYKDFIVGLRIAIGRSGYASEKDFAQGIMNPVTLSNNLNFKNRMNPKNIDLCAKKLNMDPTDIALLAREPKEESPVIMMRETDINDDPSVAVASFVASYSKQKRRLERYAAIIQMCSRPISLVNNDLVTIFQNYADIAIKGNLVGTTFCNFCDDHSSKKPCKNCPVSKCLKTGERIEQKVTIKGDAFLVVCDPATIHGEPHAIVSASHSKYISDIEDSSRVLRAQFMAVINTTNMPIILGAPNRDIVAANTAWLDLFGMDINEIQTVDQLWSFLLNKIKKGIEDVMRISECAREYRRQGWCRAELVTGENVIFLTMPVNDHEGNNIGTMARVLYKEEDLELYGYKK